MTDDSNSADYSADGDCGTGDSGHDVPPPRWYGFHTPPDVTPDAWHDTASVRHDVSSHRRTVWDRTMAARTGQVDTTSDTTSGAAGAEIAERLDAVGDGARPRSTGIAGADAGADAGIHNGDRPGDGAGYTAGAGDRDGSVDKPAGEHTRSTPLSTPLSAPLGSTASVREVARAARHAFLSTDLLHAGPGLWPFGRRAQERRARNRAATAEAHRRRDQFRTAFDTRSDTELGTHHGSRAVRAGLGGIGLQPAGRRSSALVAVGMTGVVVAVVVAAVWWGGRDPRPGSQPARSPGLASTTTLASSTVPGSSPTATDVESGYGSLPVRPPIPEGGAEAVTPGPDTPVDAYAVRVVDAPSGDPSPVEVATPEAAMRAWLARLCPFSHEDEFGAAERRARATMTDAGWSTLNPHNTDPHDGDAHDARARASWETTVAAGESGRCAEPTAQVSLEAPRSATSAIVIGTVTRVVTAPGEADAAPYAEQLFHVRVVRRGGDGLWRVDLPTEGG